VRNAEMEGARRRTNGAEGRSSLKGIGDGPKESAAARPLCEWENRLFPLLQTH